MTIMKNDNIDFRDLLERENVMAFYMEDVRSLGIKEIMRRIYEKFQLGYVTLINDHDKSFENFTIENLSYKFEAPFLSP